jgi:hypothetical protein
MARKLKTIAKWINEYAAPALTATVEPVTVSTDRRVPTTPGSGRKARIPGKGRRGTLLTVKDADGEIVLSHNSAHGFRTNAEVEAWLDQWILAQQPKKRSG